MALNVVSAERPSDADVIDAIRELQRMKVAVVAGAAADTDIAVAGIATVDTLVEVLEHAAPEELAGTVAIFDRTAQTTITAAGIIRVSVATNTNAQRRLVVRYFDKA